MKITKEYLNELTYQIIGAAIEVHKELGPGLLEKVYEECMIYELNKRGLEVTQQVSIPIQYKDKKLRGELRLDLLIENLIIMEVKAVEKLIPIHEAQLLSYMKLAEKPKGILLNFHCTNLFYKGQKTLVNKLYASLS
ncbi:MAG: GxxExxY protein [Bacteroidetes bacterium]|nr:GxxExxY protein [Bacteroidota bacterium]MCB0844108.1 GxxExxY protein [Bacteroidota bacterium]